MTSSMPTEPPQASSPEIQSKSNKIKKVVALGFYLKGTSARRRTVAAPHSGHRHAVAHGN
uniref:Uncharacterized protein n=1 Tax=Leersia perrieri TaxID=77586 RepID=A0A0D9UW26_9ORYZ